MLNTTQTLSAEMQTYYEKTLIDNAEPKLVYDSFGDKYPIPKNGGKTIQFRRFAPLAKATKPITEGVTPQGNSLQVTPVSVSINQYGDFVQVSDILKLSSVDNTIVQLTKILGSQAGRTLDTITRDVLCAGTNVIYANNKNGETQLREELDETSKLEPDLFYRAAAQLSAMNAEPIGDSYVAIIHPYTAYDLMRSEEWIDSHKYARPENLFNGEIGKIGNVRFVKSTEAKVYKSPNLAGTRTLTVKSVNGTSVTVNESLTADEASALAGRIINIGEGLATVTNATSAGVLTLDTALTANAGDIVYPAESGKKGLACFATVVLGAHAYATTEIEGGGLEHIVKQNGYGEDPLNQRASCGWKATKAIKRLVEEYIVRIESTSGYSNNVEAN
ncbi:MAG: N4-gp56 family major capsid protein [Christensenellaceae bacterium]|nr:N4-gp56 family major capsid protein [Christensenellaceae bacterium]